MGVVLAQKWAWPRKIFGAHSMSTFFGTTLSEILDPPLEQSAGTDVSLSLFGGLCSQTASPLDYSSAIWLARMAKGRGYKCRVGASLHFLPSYAVSTAGRFLTLSLAIVLILHGWCRCSLVNQPVFYACAREEKTVWPKS